MTTRNGTLFFRMNVTQPLRRLFDALIEYQRVELGSSAELQDSHILSAAALEQIAFAARDFTQTVEALPEGDQPRGYGPRSIQVQYRVAYNWGKYGPWSDFDGKPILFEAEDGINRHLVEMRIKPSA